MEHAFLDLLERQHPQTSCVFFVATAGSDNSEPSAPKKPTAFWQDDFALVLMEDADGEVLSLTEEYPTNDHFKAWF